MNRRIIILLLIFTVQTKCLSDLPSDLENIPPEDSDNIEVTTPPSAKTSQNPATKPHETLEYFKKAAIYRLYCGFKFPEYLLRRKYSVLERETSFKTLGTRLTTIHHRECYDWLSRRDFFATKEREPAPLIPKNIEEPVVFDRYPPTTPAEPIALETLPSLDQPPLSARQRRIPVRSGPPEHACYLGVPISQSSRMFPSEYNKAKRKPLIIKTW